MTKKHFNAILAKNDIAKWIKQDFNDIKSNSFLPYEAIRLALKDIEKQIGEGNQPSIDDVISSEF